MSYFTRKAKDIFLKRHGFLFPAKDKEVNETLELVEIYFEARNKKTSFHKNGNHNHHKRLHLVKR